jgi:hypothetical protein
MKKKKASNTDKDCDIFENKDEIITVCIGGGQG